MLGKKIRGGLSLVTGSVTSHVSSAVCLPNVLSGWRLRQSTQMSPGALYISLLHYGW